MQDLLSKAERYRKAANKYGELAKNAQAAYLGDLYRKIAVRYVFMAEDLLRQAEKQGKVEQTVKERDVTLEESLTAILKNAALLKRH